MKTGTFVAAAIAAGVFLLPSAFAQTYVSAGYTQLDVDVANNASIDALTLRVGQQLSPFFAIEGEASTGISEGAYDVGGGALDFKLKSQIGAFAVGRLPMPVIGTLIGRVGYASTDFDDRYDNVRDGDGGAYGIGLEFNPIWGVDVRLDYTEYGGGMDVDSLGISAGVKF